MIQLLKYEKLILIKETMISETLKSLLKTSKQSPKDWEWKLVSITLKDVYGYELDMFSCLVVCVKAYKEASNQPLFEIPNHDISQKLLMAPITGFNSLSVFPRYDEKYSLEQFYNCMFKLILSELRTARVDWCKEEVFGASVIKSNSNFSISVNQMLSEDILPSIEKFKTLNTKINNIITQVEKSSKYYTCYFRDVMLHQEFFVYGDDLLNYDYPKWCKCNKIKLDTGIEYDGISFMIDPMEVVYIRRS